MQNLQRAPFLAFMKPKGLKYILVRADISPRSVYNGQNVIRDDIWRAKTSNAHKNSAAHIQENNSSYTAMPTARQNILSTSLNVQFVAFNTSDKLNNNLVNAWMATEAMQIANLTFHSAYISDGRATMIHSENWKSP